MRFLYIRVAFTCICERLVSRFLHFKLSSTSTDLMSYDKPVTTLPARFWILQFIFQLLSTSISLKANSNQNKLLQGYKGVKWDKRFNSSQSSYTSARLFTLYTTGFEPVTSRYRCDALPTELWSPWRWEQVNCGFICSYVPVEVLNFF